MSLTVHRSSRVDLLAESLAAHLAVPQDDPFATELVVVPAKGVERWLSQRLSHRLGVGTGDDGVCAGVEFRAPRSLVTEVLHGGDDDPSAPDALVWPLLREIDAAVGQPWAPALTRHLGGAGLHGDDLRRGRRWSVAHRLARLFASYAAQRPGLLQAWEAGDDADVGADLVWQPELWRRLVASMGVPTPGQRHRAAIHRVTADPQTVPVPPRLSLFGHTRLTVTEVDLLQALAVHREVDVWLPHASDALWQALRVPTAGGPVARADDPTHLAAEHPLLATLGRDVRELQRTLAPVAAVSVALDAPVDRPATLLGRLQADLEANRAPAGDHVLDPADRSVQVHACHGAARQVQVLREVVLGLLADDPTLEPRDVVVMCPDIERFAPLVEAAFGLGGVVASTEGWHPGQQLRVRLADRSLVQTNPLLGVLDRVLTLADGRAEVTAVLDLAATEPVRRRFGLSDDDLDTIARWVDATGVRWAFDAAHRDRYGLAAYPQNTWRFGIDRVLTGVAVSADAQRWFGTALPHDAVGSSDIDLAGRLAELIDRLRHVTDLLTGEHPVGHWTETLRTALGSLTDVGWGDEWQQHQAEQELAAIGTEQADASLRLRLSDVRSLMRARLVGRPTRANFRTGSVTVCTMVPMRSVPHRVVCLLGLDDGVFPRAGSPDGDDVLARRPITGERDPRSEDRQLLLDAVLAASEHLVITYSGADEVSGRPRPPAVPLGEVLDALDLTAPQAARSVVVHHPLQPFDARNFTPGALVAAAPFSFDSAARDAALPGRAPRVDEPRLADLVLPPAPRDDVDLAALGSFLRTPVKELLRRRLGLSVFEDDDVLADAIPLELDGLSRWGVGSAMLADRLAGRSLDESLQLAWRRGGLPPGTLGWQVAQAVAISVDPLASKALDVMAGVPRSSLDVDVDLGDGRRLRGTVTGLHGDRVVEVSYSGFGARHYLDAWLPLLALSAGRPGTPWTAGTIARYRDSARLVVFNPIDPDVARQHLRDLVDLRDLGLTRPLRLPLKTGFSRARYGERNAPRDWIGSDRFEGERGKDLHPRVWGPQAPYEVLLDAEPHLTIDALAERLWRPVLDAAVLP